MNRVCPRYAFSSVDSQAWMNVWEINSDAVYWNQELALAGFQGPRSNSRKKQRPRCHAKYKIQSLWCRTRCRTWWVGHPTSHVPTWAWEHHHTIWGVEFLDKLAIHLFTVLFNWNHRYMCLSLMYSFVTVVRFLNSKGPQHPYCNDGDWLCSMSSHLWGKGTEFGNNEPPWVQQ
jgi:hypothetical protein